MNRLFILYFQAYAALNRYALKVVWRNFQVYKKTWVTSVTFYFIEPVLYLAALGFGLGVFIGEINGLSYMAFIAPGIVAVSSMWTAASEATYSSFVKIHFQKIYHAMVAAPLTLTEVVAGEILYAAFKAVIYGMIIVAVISALGLVSSSWLILAPLVLFAAGLIFAELGMIWTGLVPKIDHFAFFFTLIVTPMFLFSGVFFPVDALPEIVQTVVWISPLYHIVIILRALASGELGLSLVSNALWLIAVAGILFPLPQYFLKKRLGLF